MHVRVPVTEPYDVMEGVSYARRVWTLEGPHRVCRPMLRRGPDTTRYDLLLPEYEVSWGPADPRLTAPDDIQGLEALRVWCGEVFDEIRGDLEREYLERVVEMLGAAHGARLSGVLHLIYREPMQIVHVGSPGCFGGYATAYLAVCYGVVDPGDHLDRLYLVQL